MALLKAGGSTVFPHSD